jgi:hypothetical protein
MYSTSSPSTRVLWAAHSYNVAYSDEIGHFEYCAAQTRGRCTSPGASDPSGVDADDTGCRTGPAGVPPNTVSLTGCRTQDIDFDAPQYFDNWPGTSSDPAIDASIHAAPVTFSSPLFSDLSQNAQENQETQNYSQAAFENDLPRVEGFTNPPCQRHVYNPSDPSPGSGCVNPAAGSTFYPFFNASSTGGRCLWYEGGAFTPHNAYEGVSTTVEYGGLQEQIYPAAGNVTQGIYETFHNTLPSNPCPATPGNTQ